MNNAAVCDRCWVGAMVQWKRKNVSLSDIARTFGVDGRSVLQRFEYAQVRPGNIREGRRRSQQLQYWHNRERIVASKYQQYLKNGGSFRLPREEKEFASDGVSQSGQLPG